MDSALVGVLIGGGLTIAGQLIAEALRSRATSQREARPTRASARIQRIELWQGQTAILEALSTLTWWPPSMDPVLRSDPADRRLLAQHLDGSSWGRVSTAWRKFQERLAERDQAGAHRDLSEIAIEKLLVTFFSLDEARAALAPLCEMSQEYRPLPPRFDRELIERLTSSESWITPEAREVWLPDEPAV